ncbi:F0F1 ATP synthase subunit B [Candidatus Gottesmanbacteria bacterium]|nr:F0F1 ATP synthase subunit B [Candidatus Gottesmanbacteria bacterium]
MEQLGIELPLLLTQVVNFAIMLVVLTKLLYKPILNALSERRKKIEEGLAFTEKAKQEEEKLAMRKQEMLRDTRDEVKVILENARSEAKQAREDLIAAARKESEAERKRMEKELESRFEEMRRDLSVQTVDIAAEMVKRLLGDILTTEDQHKLIYKQLERLEKRHEKQR